MSAARASRSRRNALSISISLVAICAALLIAASGASAAYNVLDFKVTPSTKQAGGHPKLHYHVDPDAANADSTGGDDLKKIVIDYAAGLLGNPEAASPKCTDAQFNGDTCPAGSYIGSMVVKWREAGGVIKAAPGSVYVLSATSPGSAATVGFVIRPPTGWRKVFLKTEVTGVVTVRSGVDADYGLTITIDNIPRTITSTSGSVKNITVSDIAADINARTGTSQNGKYFTFNPTRCTNANSRATITSYGGVTVVKNSAFLPTGCGSVPFNPTASVTPVSLVAGQSTGVSATFTVPTADATIQNSHVQSIQVDLPLGTGLDFPAIGAIPELCSDAELNLDACPPGSKIGNVSANVPFLPPAKTGDVYLMVRSSSIVYGYVLRGANGVKAMLKGQVAAVDIDGDGVADRVRATAGNMPQVPWSSATIEFTSALIKNPTSCPSNPSVTTRIAGWSGAVATRSSSWGTLSCPVIDVTPPEVTITAPVDDTHTAAPAVALIYTATDDSGVAPSCTIPSGSTVHVTAGWNVISVSCQDAAGNSTYRGVDVFRDNTAPVIVNPQCALNLPNSASCTLTYSATDNSGLAPTCSPPSGSVIALQPGSNAITITCYDLAGNAGSASLTIFIEFAVPTVSITAPANNTNTVAGSINVAYTVDGATTIPAGTTCTVGGSASTSATTNPVALVIGSNSISVTCSNSFGSDSKTVNVNRGAVPVVQITSPTTGSQISGPTVNVTYTVNGGTTIPAGTTCTVNGVASVSTTTNTVTLGSGSTTIFVSCTNAFGVSEPSVVMVNPGGVPAVTITSPANNSTTTASSINVAFTVNGSSAIPAGTTCAINGTPTTSASVNPVALVLGTNSITVACSNSFGTGSKSITVNRGEGWPMPTIVSPANGTHTTAASINVAYTVNGSSTLPSGVVCTVNGVSSSTPATNSVPLVAGANAITVMCTNAFGTAPTATITVYRDVAPTVAIVSPANSSSSANASINVSYTVNGVASIPAGTTCTVNGVASTSATSNTVAIGVGFTTITVVCTNAFGAGSSSVTVNWNPPPTLVITSPANGTVTSASSISVTFVVNGASTVPAGTTCLFDGTRVAIPIGTDIPLALGANTISLTCTNAFGSSTAVVTVTRV
ncbi:MAG: hypothetical protein HZB14_07350 [Actinobacteria bacterium]|nr:hypothetical protein [Actinomycetota bacterium]